MPDRLTIADINLGYYAHNISEIFKLVADDVKVMAIVKANAYGHGIEKIAETAVVAGASYLGVVSLGELKRIRKARVKTPILILNYLDAASVSEAVEHDASVTVMDENVVSAIQEAASKRSKNVKVHIEVDTGMHRAGCDPNMLLAIAKKVTAAKNLELEGLFTHFAESEAIDASFTLEQLKAFHDSINTLQSAGISPPLLHCANSAAIIHFPETHLTMVRPGLVSYGLNPFPVDHPRYKFVAEHFKPVLSLRTQIVLIRTIDSGESVGYNRRWRAKKPTKIALLPVGYGDGYRRTPMNADKVLVNGQYAPIIGTVAMDQTVIDITGIKGSVSEGDEVMLLGEQGDSMLSADSLADAYKTVNYEVVTALSERIVRSYIK